MKPYVAPLGLLLAVAAATPTAHHLVVRPVPSPFPGHGNACTNEPKYLNFDVSKRKDLDTVNKLHEAFCHGIGTMFENAITVTEAENRKVYERWFVEDDDQDPPEDERIQSVYMQLWDKEKHQARPIVADFIFDNTDFQERCGEKDAEVAGYTGEDEDEDDVEKTHFCPAAFEFPTKPDEIACASLHDYPDIEMESLSRIMLHELTHYKIVGTGSLIGFQIIDTINNDGLAAYYPSRCHALVTEKPDRVEDNADNYAWLAANAFYAVKCKKTFENPPPYTPGVPGDP